MGRQRITDQRPPKAEGRWIKRSIIIFLGAAVSVAAVVATGSMLTSLPAIADKTAAFAAVMRVVRPVLLFALLMLWQPLFRWLHRRAVIHGQTEQKAIAIWPKLVIWTGLIELTLGQGYVLLGLLATLLYGLYVRWMREDPYDR